MKREIRTDSRGSGCVQMEGQDCACMHQISPPTPSCSFDMTPEVPVCLQDSTCISSAFPLAFVTAKCCLHSDSLADIQHTLNTLRLEASNPDTRMKSKEMLWEEHVIWKSPTSNTRDAGTFRGLAGEKTSLSISTSYFLQMSFLFLWFFFPI